MPIREDNITVSFYTVYIDEHKQFCQEQSDRVLAVIHGIC